MGFYCFSCYNWCQCGGINLGISVIIVVTRVFTALAGIAGGNMVVLTWLYLLLLLSHGFYCFSCYN